MNQAAQQTGGVLFIAPSAYPLGGVAVWMNYLVAGLRARGVRASVGLVAGRWHDANAYRGHYPALEAFLIDNATGSTEGRIRAIERAVEAQQPAIVMAVNIFDVYAAVRRMRLRGSHVRLATALHAIDADLLEDLRSESDVIDAVIASNRLAAKLCIERAGLADARVMYAPCGVDEAHAAEATPQPAASMLRIAWVGRLEQTQKRIGDLPVLMASLDEAGVDVELTIAGDGPDRRQLLDALDPWIRRQRVHDAGALPPEEIGTRVYARADVLLITSEWETGPIVAWEAMSAGVVVVSSRYVGSGLENALKHEDNCLMFPIGDMAQAAQCIATLARDRALRDALAREARRLVEARYTIARSVDAWAACLATVLQLPPQAATTPRTVTAAGRLDRLLGPAAAQTVRSILGIRFAHRDAGGEWPHTGHAGNEQALLASAAAMDGAAGGEHP